MLARFQAYDSSIKGKRHTPKEDKALLLAPHGVLVVRTCKTIARSFALPLSVGCLKSGIKLRKEKEDQLQKEQQQACHVMATKLFLVFFASAAEAGFGQKPSKGIKGQLQKTYRCASPASRETSD